MALPPPLEDSGGEGKKRVGAQSNGGGSSREDIPRRKPRGGKRELSERQAERSSGPLGVRREGAAPASQQRQRGVGSPNCGHTPSPSTRRVKGHAPSTRNRAVRSPLPAETPRIPPPARVTRVSAICPRSGTPPQAAGDSPSLTKRDIARPIPSFEKEERKRDKSQAHRA